MDVGMWIYINWTEAEIKLRRNTTKCVTIVSQYDFYDACFGMYI